MMLREACVGNFRDAVAAWQAGANRLELCENLDVGGVTPSFGTIRRCVDAISIPTFVMIRPRGGDFVYAPDEIEIMKTDIEACRHVGISGVVFGALTSAGCIDIPLVKMLVKCARPMQVTFHKAFDLLTDMNSGLETLVSLGVNRILTSGGKATAREGSEHLCNLINYAAGRIQIVVAGNVTDDNLPQIRRLIPAASEFHGRKIV
ncbi:MAG: copper homeostasis protein CutC [Bacteroidales bacterium]|jgi:copper homeostasis protein|nr:copper homeostasis protein CutC [Bacteroidales bacterium]